MKTATLVFNHVKTWIDVHVIVILWSTSSSVCFSLYTIIVNRQLKFSWNG